MTPSELGMVYGLLLANREIHGNPPDRPLRENELEAARILSDCSHAELDDLNEFLASQGFRVHVRDGMELGIPPKQGRPNRIYVMTRLRGEPLAPYLSGNWAIEQMRDNRRRDHLKTERVVWLARMWLVLQWFFYERMDRLPSEVSRYREAIVNEGIFVEALTNGIEQMGNEGQPSGEEGVAWSILWGQKESIQTYAAKFLKIMEDAGLIQGAGSPGDYRQTLVAAVDMAAVAEHELVYLMPSGIQDVSKRTVELIQGYSIPEGKDAITSAH